MDPALIIVLLVLAAAALFILPPLLRGDEAPSPPARPAASEALAEALSRRDASYEALADLEFDHASGKVSAGEFAALKAQYQKAAVAALQDLEALKPGSPDDEAAPGDRTGAP